MEQVGVMRISNGWRGFTEGGWPFPLKDFEIETTDWT